jgi:hypothetical protein
MKNGGAGGVPLLAQGLGEFARGCNRMPLRFFAVPVHDSSKFEQELNGFLASHKVVSIDRHLIDQGINSFWAICVDYLSDAPGEMNRNLIRFPTPRICGGPFIRPLEDDEGSQW